MQGVLLQPTGSAEHCTQCQRAFGVMTWRHNCRFCGLVFCDSCSPKRSLKVVMLADGGKTIEPHDIRSCSKCAVANKGAVIKEM